MNNQDKELLREFFKTLVTPGMYVTSPKYRQRLSHDDPQDATYLGARSIKLIKLLKPLKNKAFARIAEMMEQGTYIKVVNAPGHKDGIFFVDRYHDVSPSMGDYHWAEGWEVSIFSVIEVSNELGIDFPE